MKTNPFWVKAMLMLSLVTGLSSITIAQNQFRLSEYVNPDYQWRKLELGFGLGGSNNFDDRKIGNEESYHEQDHQMYYNSDADLNYYSTKNTQKYQGYQSFLISGSVNGMKRGDQDNINDTETTRHNNTQRIYFSGRTENRFYNLRKQFLEVDLDLSSSIFNGKSEYNGLLETVPFWGSETSKDHQYAITASLPVLIGFGRIEEVQDARLAVYILDDLKQSGDLKRAPTSEEVLAFSRFITETKNRRFFDTRIQKINEITRIDSMLNAMGLKARSEASYFTILNDDWDFANGPIRKTGGRFSVGIIPNILWSYHYSNTNTEFEDTPPAPIIVDLTTKSWQSLWGIDFKAGYIWEKPANLYWQHTIIVNLAYALEYDDRISKSYRMDTLSNDFRYETDSPNLELTAGYRLGFYPNTRTELVLGINNILGQRWEKVTTGNLEDMKANTFEFAHELNLNCYYYISEQLRLTVTIQNTYNHDHYTFPDYPDSKNAEHKLKTSFGAGLVYKIF